MDAICTPRRRSKPPQVETRHAARERRKSLFGVCEVSPLSSPDSRKGYESGEAGRGLSPSWSDGSPAKKSPLKAHTPVKSLQNDFTQMALTMTPPNRTSLQVIEPCTPASVKKVRSTGPGSVRRSPRLGGVRALSPDRGLITPKTFYGKSFDRFGSSGPHTDGKTLFQRIRESVRVRLPMETIPKESKKRARCSSSGGNRRPKKIPRYRLFEEDKPKVKKSPKSPAVRKSPRSGRKSSPADVETDLERELADLAQQQRKSTAKERKSTGDRPTYNWHFFNAKTPPASKVSKMFSDRSPSVLTPPPTHRKRKLISAFDLDHLPQDEEDNDENCSSAANQGTKGNENVMSALVRGIIDDFSENEDEDNNTGREATDVDQLIENLNKDVAEILEEIPSEKPSPVKLKKLYPVFTERDLSTSTPAVGRSPLAAKRRKADPQQLILDVGQKGLREVLCSQCGLLFVKGDDTDEAFHQKHHARATVLSFNGWKNARTVRLTMTGDRVILVKSGDPKPWWDKARSVLEVVDYELGYPSETPGPKQVYMYVKNKRVVGCLAAAPLRSANRVLPDLGLDTELCSVEEYPVRVGVSRIWVAAGHRREGIASVLVDTLRRNFAYGEILRADDVAFSSPTDDGRRFAAKYFSRDDYLIYTFAPSY